MDFDVATPGKDPNKLGNYRPIVPTSDVWKLLERKKALIAVCQIGFHIMEDEIRKAHINKGLVSAVFVFYVEKVPVSQFKKVYLWEEWLFYMLCFKVFQ